jgi:quercetin dioxygenase-like cupin family protein
VARRPAAGSLIGRVATFDDLETISPQRIWEGVLARAVHGDLLSLAVVELAPGSVVPEHHHANEQLGLVLEGTLTFRVGDETRELRPGATWSIPGDVPHEVRVGAEGAVVIDVFAPPRDDWQGLAPAEPQPPRWPRGDTG